MQVLIHGLAHLIELLRVFPLHVKDTPVQGLPHAFHLLVVGCEALIHHPGDTAQPLLLGQGHLIQPYPQGIDPGRGPLRLIVQHPLDIHQVIGAVLLTVTLFALHQLFDLGRRDPV